MKTNLPITNNEVLFPKGRYIVSRTDLKGAITYVNGTFVTISGFARDELVGKNHNLVRHPEMPPAAFQLLWDTVKAGRPWRGMVKNRCKNGDFYWVDALVVPVCKDGQTTGYMSVRHEPTRSQIAAAEEFYRQMRDDKVKLPKTPFWKRGSFGVKLNVLLGLLLAAQLVLGVQHMFGSSLGVSELFADWLVFGSSATALVATFLLFFMQNQVMSIVGRVGGRLDHIAQGDLTDDIPLARADELGQLNDSLVTMQTHLKTMMAEIAESAEVMGDSASVLGAQMDQTRAANAVQSDAVTGIAAEVEHLVVSVNEVAASAQQATQAVQASHALLGQASASMGDSLAATASVVSTVSDAGRTMTELSQSIQAIDRVSQVI
ncbi:MAG: PAS domain-containing protein, partial [Propionivibrio sp.]